MDVIAKVSDIIDSDLTVINCSRLTVAGTMYLAGQKVNKNHVVTSVKISDLDPNQLIAIQFSKTESNLIVFLIGLLQPEDFEFVSNQALDAYRKLQQYHDESRNSVRNSIKFKECKDIRGILLDANRVATQIWYDLYIGMKYSNIGLDNLTAILQDDYPGYDLSFYHEIALKYTLHMR